MRKTLITLLMTAALSCWSFAQANPNSKNTEEKSEHKTSAQMKDADASNPNGSVSITSGPNVNAQSNSATITWTTNNRAATIVHYGTDVNNLSEKSRQPGGERDHSVTLSNLQPGTHYFFAIMTDDNTVRQKGEFTTQGGSSASASSGSSNPGSVSITSGPTVSPSSTSATISWTTDKSAANEVRYGTDANNPAQHWYEPGGSTQHTATLSNLQPGTTYYYQIRERNGGVRTSGQFQTTGTATAAASTPSASTGTVQLTEQPKLAAVGDRAATVRWTTNAAANSVVKYGTSIAALSATANGAWGTNHTVTLSNLQPNTLYYFQVSSGQTVNAATAAKGPVLGFKTLQAGQQAKINPPCCTVFSH